MSRQILQCSGPEQEKTDDTRHVVILLALYKGADFIEAQLESLARQTHSDWSLIVSDDGSTDCGIKLIHRFRNRYPAHNITVINGPRQGAAANFLFLLTRIPPHADFMAFCDQDDVWHSDKLEHAVRQLSEIDVGVAGLYCGRTEVTDHEMRIRGLSPPFRRRPAFANALVQSIAGGNTMVLNRPAVDTLLTKEQHARNVVSHDWWAYQVITAIGGVIIFDRHSKVFYRQHGSNLVGENSSLGAILHRAKELFRGRFREWNAANIDALTPMIPEMTPEARRCFLLFEEARHSRLPKRMILLGRSGVYRQTRRGTVSLWIAGMIRRL